MKTTIFIIRHGKTVWNLEQKMQGSLNSPLTEEGIYQAKCLSKRMSNHTVDAIYSSSSPRAIETTEHVFPSRDFTIDDAIAEINMGIWEGKTFSWIDENYPQQWYNFFKDPLQYQPTEGETYLEVNDRVAPFVKNILTNHEGETIALVSHRITSKLIIQELMGDDFEQLGKQEDILSTSLTKIVIEDGIPTLEFRSNIDHYEIIKKHYR